MKCFRETAAFKNPAFYKNQSMGLSNFSVPRFIYLGSDEGHYIKIPRGLFDDLLESCAKAGIQYRIDDKRNSGISIDVSFTATLKGNQAKAARDMLNFDCGILNAATAFGKTVVCCSIIAQRKTNTLILLQSSSLISQWKEAISNFLEIREDLPEYTTPSGKIKKRKEIVGVLQGPTDTTGGVIDIAMVGSVCKGGKWFSKLDSYGMVIVDECHHAASDTITQILQRTKARYVYGATATTYREDGLEKVNFMLLGPVHYRFTAKERANEQGIAHLVYPRFTRSVVPGFSREKMHPNEAYEILRKDTDRDDLIVSDVVECVRNKRTPVVLSRYVDHTKRLYERLKDSADHVFLLLGENSKKEHAQILAQLKDVRPDESMLLLATGKLVGEGFDFPRLDTLIMAMPVAGQSVVEQYAGRLNRDYEGKQNVIIYDYVDWHIPTFERMYHKRLKAYKQIGFDIVSDACGSFTEEHTIYSSDDYRQDFDNDLLCASSEVIISSPAISSAKINSLTKLLKQKQESGLKVIVITWEADRYGYGDSGKWMSMHEDMRRAGIEVNLVEDYCERFCIIDRIIVWYGSVNFLGKEDSDDNLMRLKSEKIAAELLELTFGGDKVLPAFQETLMLF
ncbi:MAG: DEAD/DEAH box helicase family protein [Eggerthellaceae bacterium]|nr:DEAD/DEAH box helicase family protein [Eggerthellaceae bacterium]